MLKSFIIISKFLNNQILILDFRPREQFELCHLVGSISIPVEKCLESDFTSFKETRFINKFCSNESEKQRLKKRKRLLVVLVSFNRNSDQLLSLNSSLVTSKYKSRTKIDPEDLQSLRNAMLMQTVLVKERHRDCYLNKSGMDVFQDKYPFLCTFDNRPTASVADCGTYPSEIFEAFLYLSNCKVAKDANILETLGITHILNVSDSVPNYFEENYLGLKYYNIDVEDVENAPIEKYFEYAYKVICEALYGEDEKAAEKDDLTDLEECYSDEFDTQTLKLDSSSKTIDLWENCEVKRTISFVDKSIDTVHKKNSKSRILVHCAMGKSRSATIVTMFIMKRFKLPLDVALRLVSQRREKIDINPGFIEKLKEFETNGFKFDAELDEGFSESTEAEECTLTFSSP